MANHKESVEKGLQYLKGSDEIVGKIVAYCVNAYKADPSDKTLERVRQYVSDTANSISEHVLSIGTNLSRIIDYETKEIDDLVFNTNCVAQRLTQAQNYMCELYMMKFQTFPRPHPTINILRQKIPDDQLPKYARSRRAWNRPKEFDYKVLDQVGKIVQANNNQDKAEDDSGAFLSAPAESEVDNGMYKSKIVDPNHNTFSTFNNDNLPSMEMKSPPQLPMIPNIPSPPQQQQQQQQPPPPSAHQSQASQAQIPPPPSNIGPPPPPKMGGMGGPPPIPKPNFAQQFQQPPPPPSNMNIPPPPMQGNNMPPPPPMGGGGGGGGPPIPPPPQAQQEVSEEIQRFVKMLKMGVPRQAVMNKMTQEGLDPASLP